MSTFIKQQGETCWFHSAMNGFLHSKYGRTFLRNIIKNESHEIIKYNSCPMMNSKRSRLLGLINLYLKERLFNTKENRNTFTNTTITDGASMNTQIKMYKKILGDNFKFLKTQLYSNDYLSTIPKKLRYHTLSHSIIKFNFGENNIHGVSGGIDINNKFFVYDSNGYYHRCNWTIPSGQEELKIKMAKIYKKPFNNITLDILAVWIDNTQLRLTNINNTINEIKKKNNSKILQALSYYRNKRSNNFGVPNEIIQPREIKVLNTLRNENIKKQEERIKSHNKLVFTYSHPNYFNKLKTRKSRINIKSINKNIKYNHFKNAYIKNLKTNNTYNLLKNINKKNNIISKLSNTNKKLMINKITQELTNLNNMYGDEINKKTRYLVQLLENVKKTLPSNESDNNKYSSNFEENVNNQREPRVLNNAENRQNLLAKQKLQRMKTQNLLLGNHIKKLKNMLHRFS